MTSSFGPNPTALAQLRRGALLVALAAFLSLALVHHPQGGWNVNTRLALVAAVANQGTFRIDSWHDTPPYHTGDKALFDGHYYSDKIFGVSLLALPPAWILARLPAPLPFEWWHYLLRLWAVAVPAAISTGLFFFILGRLGVPPRRALLATVATFLGTMWYTYSTVFYPYAPGIACQMGALWLILHPPARRMTLRNAPLIGFLLGYSWLCDQIFGIGAAFLSVVYVLRLLDQGGILGMRAFAEMAGLRSRPPELVKLTLAFAAGALVSPALFALYTWSIFGEVTNPYAHHANPLFAEGMSKGLMGIGLPDATRLFFVTVHPIRGLFFWSPVLLAAVWGCWLGTRAFGKRRLLGWLGLAMLAAYLFLNAGYYMWWGGWSHGPRFMIPAIPFVALGLGELLRPGKALKKGEAPPDAVPYGWLVVAVLGSLSVALTMPFGLTDPQVPQGARNEVFSAARASSRLPMNNALFLRAFYRGEFTPSLRDRFMRVVTMPERPWRNRAGYAVLLLIVAAPGVVAWRRLPAKPLFVRIDYPAHSTDGSLGPPPPR